ncbi:unnamed protein product [Ectocarpus sp. 13 AM-2016]
MAEVEDRIVISKRKGDGEDGGQEKRLRVETQAALAIVEKQNIARSSTLLAPTMLLTGHQAAVYTLKFDPTGLQLASAGADRAIFLWDTRGECANYNVLRGHKNAILELHWSPNSPTIITASADKTLGYWDANAGKRKKTFKGHTGVVNSCSISRTGNLVASASDDGFVKLWDPRVRRSVAEFMNQYQVTAVCLSRDDQQVMSGGIDNEIKVFDVRKLDIAYTMTGHTDTVTGLALSPDGNHLLSNSMDNSVIMWDVRPFVNQNRLEKTFHGIKHGGEKNLLKCAWSPDGKMVSAGSSDQAVHIWDEPSTQELYFLPGHTGSVNEMTFHPTESIIGSCGSDKNIYLGEIGA